MGIYGTSIKIPEKTVENPSIQGTCYSDEGGKSQASPTPPAGVGRWANSLQVEYQRRFKLE
jgi:hypothetical protein